MRKFKCENCLIQITCTQTCLGFTFQIMQLSNEIEKNKKKIRSKNGHRRKRLKDEHLKHFNALVKNWNRCSKIRNSIWERHALKIGLSQTSSGYSSGPSVSSNSNVRNKIKTISLWDYVEKFYVDNKGCLIKDAGVRVKVDNLMLRTGIRKYENYRRA